MMLLLKMLPNLLMLRSLCLALPSPYPTEAHVLAPRQGTASSHIVRRFFNGSFVLGDALYIDGGECSTTDWQLGQEVCNGALAVDLSAVFSTDGTSRQPPFSLIDKGDCPNFNLPAFWVDTNNGTAFMYGGEYSYLNPWIGPTTVPPEAWWAFTLEGGGTWTNIDQSFDDTFPTLTRPSYGGYTYGEGLGGFYLGGKHGSRGSQKTNIGGYTSSPGMQFFNFTDQSWTNSSTSKLYDTGTFVSGSLQYTQNWGDAGLVVVLGGQDHETQRFLPWNNITLFDPATQNWYHQTAAGDVPSIRGAFCNVGIGQNASNGTYEIFVYGGSVSASEGAATAGDALYILTMPAFHWFRVDWPTGDPRFWHTCNLAGNSQMLSVGGLNPTLNGTISNYTNEQTNTTDPYFLGIKVLDLDQSL